MTDVDISGINTAGRASRRWMVLSLYASNLAIGAVFSRVKAPAKERTRDQAMTRACQIASGLPILIFHWLSAAANSGRWWHPATPGQGWDNTLANGVV